MKSRHSGPSGSDFKPFYYEGINYSFLAFGTNDFEKASSHYCRYGMNEVGLCIGNYDISQSLSEWDYVSDGSLSTEDNTLFSILGNYSTVKKAAYAIAHHAYAGNHSYAIISKETGVGAVVDVISNSTGSYTKISWVNDTFAPVGMQVFVRGLQMMT